LSYDHIKKEVLLKDNLPSQILVNEYTKNQGISSHVDDANAFGDYVITLSMCNPIQMQFLKLIHDANKSEQILEHHMLLEPGSLLVMQHDARYLWRHGIKKSKVVELPNGTILNRTDNYRRISLTVRKVLDGRKRIPINND